MVDDLTRKQIMKLSEDLIAISNYLDEVLNEYGDMQVLMKENILVDNAVVEEDKVNVCQSDLKNICREIDNGLIPRLNNLI